MKHKELWWNMAWLLAILAGVLSIPLTMIAMDHLRWPGVVSYTVPSKSWTSMYGYRCVAPEYQVVCTEPTPEPTP